MNGFLGFWDSIPKRCKGVHCVDLGESFPTSIYLQKSASIQPRTSPSKFGGNHSILFNRVLSRKPLCISDSDQVSSLEGRSPTLGRTSKPSSRANGTLSPSARPPPISPRCGRQRARARPGANAPPAAAPPAPGRRPQDEVSFALRLSFGRKRQLQNIKREECKWMQRSLWFRKQPFRSVVAL